MKKIETDDDWKRFCELTGSEFSSISFVSSSDERLKISKRRIFFWIILICAGVASGRYVHGLHALFSVFMFPYALHQGYRFNKSSKGVYDYYWINSDMRAYTKKIASRERGEIYMAHQINFVGSLFFMILGLNFF